MVNEDGGALPAILVSTVSVFYVIFGTTHDIADGDERAIVWVFLATSAVVFLILYRLAIRTLDSRDRIIWLAGTALLLLLCNLGVAGSLVQSRYPKGSALSLAFLCAGLPTTAVVVRRLVHEKRPQL